MAEPEQEFDFKGLFLPFTSPKAVFFLILIGILVFCNGLFNSFVFDDIGQLLNNPQIVNFHPLSYFLGSTYYSGNPFELVGLYYKPLFTLTISILFQFSKSAFIFHALQLTIHIINSILLYFIFTKFFKDKLSFFLALIFLIHPANAESVLYVSDMQEPLFTLFGLSALLISASIILDNRKLIVISVLLFLSILSKETGLLYLLTIPLYSFLFNKKYIYKLSGISAGVFLVYLFLRFFIAKIYINHQAIAPIMSAGFIERLLTIPKIIYSFLLLYFFPKNLSWGQHWIVKSADTNNFLFPLFVVFLITFLLVLLLYYLKVFRNERKTLIFFGVVSIIGLGFHSQLIPLDFTFSERWIYFPIIGFLGLTGVIINEISLRNKNWIYVILGIIVILLSARTFLRTFDFRNNYTLAIHDIKSNPNSFSLNNNLGYVFIQSGDYKKATVYLKKSISLYHSESTYNNLGFSYSKLGQSDNAIKTYRESLGLGDYYITYHNLILEMIKQKDFQNARKETNLALKKYPYDSSLWMLLALIEYNSGNKDKAIQAAQAANSISPGVSNFILNKIDNNEEISL